MENPRDAYRSRDTQYIGIQINKDKDDDSLNWHHQLDTAYRHGDKSMISTIQGSSRVGLMEMLKTACYFGDSDFVSCHMESNVDWRSLLYYACVCGHAGLASLLQDKVGSADLALLACITIMPRPTCKLRYEDLADWLVHLCKTGYINAKQLFEACKDLTLSRLGVISKLFKDRRSDILMHNDIIGEYIVDLSYSFIPLYRAGAIDRETYLLVTRDSALNSTSKLMLAICVGDTDFVYEAVGKYDDVEWRYIMDAASRLGHTKLARYIYDSRQVKVDYYILANAFPCGDVDIIAKCIGYDFAGLDTANTMQKYNILWDVFLLAACVCGHVAIVSLIAKNRKLSEVDNHILQACLRGDMDYLQQHKHILQGVPADSIGWPVYLHAACLTQHMDIFDVLIQAARRAGISLSDQMEYIATSIGHTEEIYCRQCDRTTLQTLSQKTGIAVPEVELSRLHVGCYIGLYLQFLVYAGYSKSLTMNVNKAGKYKWTPLHVVCLGQNDLMDAFMRKRKALLHDRFIVQNQDKNKLLKQRSSLHEHIDDKVNIVHLLIYAGGNVDPLDENLQTPLHLACISGAYDLVLCLLNYGANINHVDGLGMTPIAWASLHNHARIIKLLLKRKCKLQIPNIFGQNPLHHSCMGSHIESVKLLVKFKDLIDKQDDEGITPILLATLSGNEDILDVLLAHSADVNIEDHERQLPLHKAATRSNRRCAKLLLQKTTNINHQDINGCTPLQLASIQNHKNLVNDIIEFGADANIADELGCTPLHVARDSYVISSLVNNAAMINQQNYSGETPLMCTASRLDMLTMKELLAKGADMALTDHMGRGLLHAAVSSNHHDRVLRELLQIAIDIRVLNNKQMKTVNIKISSLRDLKFVIPIEAEIDRNSITWHTMRGSFHLSFIEYLLSIGMDVDCRDYNKSTALHLAAESGHLAAVQVLLQNKARPAVRDKFGHIPLMLALKHPQVFTLLWYVSQKYLMKDDIKRLFHLAHWTDTLPLLDELNIKLPPDFTVQHWAKKRNLNVSNNIIVPPVEMTRGQYAQTLTFKIDPDRISSWIRSTNDDLPGFMSEWLPSLQSLTFVQHPYVIEIMDMLMADLEVSVRTIDPLVAFHIKRCGSEDEKTKVILKDEEDCSCVQENIRFDMFETPNHAGHPVWKAFVELVAKPEYYDHLERVLDEKKRLSQSKLCQHFGSAVAKALADVNLWRKYHQLMRVTVKDITAGSKKISALLVMWSDDVYPLMEISVDLVPVIDLSGWYPSWCNPHPLIKHIDCIALPKWKMTHNIDFDLMEVGVFQWRPWFEMMPAEMRQGFRLAKVVKDKAVCPKIEDWDEVHAGEFISTYYLKQCIMKEYTDFYDQQVQGLEPEIQSDIVYARKIYDRLEKAFQERELMSIFIPEYNLLSDEKFVQYQETAVAYARLCRRLLTPESVAHFKKAYMGMKE